MLNRFNILRISISFALLLSFSSLGVKVNSAQRNALFDETVRTAAEKVSSAIVQLRYIASQPSGNHSSSEELTTGLLISADGWIVTSDFGLPSNPEPSSSPIAILVTFADGSEQTAKLIARDFPRRIALLKTRNEVRSSDVDHRISQSNWSDKVRPGETAIVLGRGYSSEQANYSIGIVSAIDRLSGRAIQIDANTSASNYGGPLLNLAGEVLGIVSPLGPPGQLGEEWYDSGIGFAVPMTALEDRLATLQSGQNIHAGWAGVQLAKGNPFSSAPIIQKTKGPAAEAGIKSGDRIIGVEDKQTSTIARFRRELRRYDAGKKLSLTLQRGEEQKKVTLTLIQKPTELDKIEPVEPLEANRLRPKEASQPVE